MIGHRAENLGAAAGRRRLLGGQAGQSRSRRRARAPLPVVRRAEMLGELMRLKWSIAVAGTHGKTTTTSMIGALLETAGLDPTVINGGIINAYGTNARLGAGDWMVVEADESDGTFTRLPATIAIVTNIDPEHLDFYGDFAALQQAFETFVGNIPFYGFAVLCIDHPVVQGMIPRAAGPPHPDLWLQPAGRYPRRQRPARPRRQRSSTSIIADRRDRQRAHDRRPVPADVRPAQRAELAGRDRGRRGDGARRRRRARPRCATSRACKRRFTKTGEWNGVTVIDDYGHHPVEIAAVLKAARVDHRGPGHRRRAAAPLLAAVAICSTSFCTCFNDADAVLVADVYAAGEAPIEGVSRDALVAGLTAHGHRNAPAAAAARKSSRRCVREHRAARRHRRLPRRRLDHQLGQQPAGRARPARTAPEPRRMMAPRAPARER